ncbi:MAG: helix-turn-helix domain-containing protein [Candidatus Methylacidiphilales bacterium]|nr:cupin domain-containing protein [Candidatus Methylacidiphilales bacterium]
MPNPSATEVHVAARIAALRKEVGLTLRELASRTGLSDAYLSRVENGQTAVTLASLEKLAAIFATPIATFFETEDEPRRVVLCRSGQGRNARFRGSKGTPVELLAEDKHGKLMEPLIVDVSSAAMEVPAMGHPGEEFNYVIEGECTFFFGDEQYLLKTGDSVYFDASIPHVLRATGGPERCRILAVVTSRDFSIHRNIAKILEERIQA